MVGVSVLRPPHHVDMFNGEKGIFHLQLTRRLRQQYSTVTLTLSVGPVQSGPTLFTCYNYQP